MGLSPSPVGCDAHFRRTVLEEAELQAAPPVRRELWGWGPTLRPQWDGVRSLKEVCWLSMCTEIT